MAQQKTYVYDSDRKFPFQGVFEIYQYRFLITQMIRRDIVTRYKRSSLGVTWAMLNPLGMMIILSVVFSKAFSSTENYAVYVLTGIVVWNFFSKSTSAAMHSMTLGGTILRRIYFPPASFAISAIGTELINMFFSLVPLALILVVMRIKITVAMLFLPVSILLIVLFSLGFALLLCRFAVFFPDVAEMYQIILTAWMYLTPVVIPLNQYPHKLAWLLKLNPMTWMVQLFRLPIYNGRMPAIEEFLVSFIMAAGMLVIGWLLFESKRNEYAYRV